METEKGKFDKIIDILFPLDMSYFFEILLEKEVIEDSLTDFHNWLKGLVDVIGYTGLSEARKRVNIKKSQGEL